MDMSKGVVVLSCVLSVGVQSFAGQGAFQAGPLVERLEQAAAGADLDRVYDNGASKGVSSSRGTVSARTLEYRPLLDAPRVIAVNHIGENGRPKGHGSFERGYDWTMHPATELLASDSLGLKIAGYILKAALFIPAVVVAVLNNIASNSRLTKGLAIHTHD
mgnify:CR=1 FL=1